MPSITLSKKALLASTKKKRSDEELKHLISFLGTDLESIKGDDIVVEIFPNRPDLLSQQGFNRAFASFVRDSPGLKEYPVQKQRKNATVIIEKQVEKIRPYTACAIVRGLKLNNQLIKDIIQIQEKLHVTYGRNRKRCAIGIYPLEHITLPITYTAKKPSDIRFWPLDAKSEMTGQQILSRHPTGREYGHLLEGKKLYPLFLDKKGSVLSMPPIINSEKTGRITAKTKEVFIECSGFSWHVVKGALAMIVCALADMGGTIEEMELQYPSSLGGLRKSPQLRPEKMAFSAEYISKYLGYDLSKKEIATLLSYMGIGVVGNHALIPAYRTDVLHQIDLFEDVAIAYGTDNIEAKIPSVATIGREDPLLAFSKKIREILIGHRLLEVKNYSLTNFSEADQVKVSSAASQSHNALRKDILGSLLTTLERNKQHDYPQNIFEIGEVFLKDSQAETGIQEGFHLAIALCAEDANYTAIRQIIDSLTSALGTPCKVKSARKKNYMKGRTGIIMVQGVEVGYLGETDPAVLERCDLTMPIAAAEIDVKKLWDAR